MTDEEKAREILGCNRDCKKCGWWSASASGCTHFKNLMSMGEWKDQQFKEYLEKKRERFYYQPKDLMNGLEKNHKLEILNEIINDLFK